MIWQTIFICLTILRYQSHSGSTDKRGNVGTCRTYIIPISRYKIKVTLFCLKRLTFSVEKTANIYKLLTSIRVAIVLLFILYNPVILNFMIVLITAYKFYRKYRYGLLVRVDNQVLSRHNFAIIFILNNHEYYFWFFFPRAFYKGCLALVFKIKSPQASKIVDFDNFLMGLFFFLWFWYLWKCIILSLFPVMVNMNTFTKDQVIANYLLEYTLTLLILVIVHSSCIIAIKVHHTQVICMYYIILFWKAWTLVLYNVI